MTNPTPNPTPYDPASDVGVKVAADLADVLDAVDERLASEAA